MAMQSTETHVSAPPFGRRRLDAIQFGTGDPPCPECTLHKIVFNPKDFCIRIVKALINFAGRRGSESASAGRRHEILVPAGAS
uniref:Uncharacterized protein n=1 Tax=Romanomermis culicivorax TaxID=13658 RepID=A0A915JUH2_ROMCU